MARAKSYVINDRKRLDQFLKTYEDLQDIEIRVGILSGRPKYEPKHVGRKSRINRQGKTRISKGELGRRKNIRELRRELAADRLSKGSKFARAKEKEIRRVFRREGISTKGLRKSTKGTAVARVAGVLNAGDSYHVISLKRRQPELRKELQQIKDQIMATQTLPKNIVIKIGENSRNAVRGGILRADHYDTGHLSRNTQFEIISVSQKRISVGAARARRGERRRAKRRRSRG
jgi:hypothetical protein